MDTRNTPTRPLVSFSVFCCNESFFGSKRKGSLYPKISLLVSLSLCIVHTVVEILFGFEE